MDFTSWNSNSFEILCYFHNFYNFSLSLVFQLPASWADFLIFQFLKKFMRLKNNTTSAMSQESRKYSHKQEKINDAKGKTKQVKKIRLCRLRSLWAQYNISILIFNILPNFIKTCNEFSKILKRNFRHLLEALILSLVDCQTFPKLLGVRG